MPGNVQIHNQVSLSDAKILKETKIVIYNLLQKYDTIISKSDNDIGQTYLIKMHIATRSNAAPIAAQLYPLALKHHGFFKGDAGIICKSISPWESTIVVVKNTHLKVYHNNSTCA